MSLIFQTLRSSSSGNCIRITCGSSTVLFDCGFRAQRDCEEALASLGPVAAAVVSHSHTDHISYAALRVLAQQNIPVWGHQFVLEQVWDRIPSGDWHRQPDYQPFADAAFELDCFEIRPMEVPHAPGVPNYGFAVRCGCGEDRRKLILCTDFCSFDEVIHEFVDADFIYVESNHDLELLRLHPNHASRYHLSNPKTAQLLAEAVGRSRRSPQAVMLGHLSRQRNHQDLALAEVRGVFERRGMPLDFPLATAPLYEPSAPLTLD